MADSKAWTEAKPYESFKGKIPSTRTEALSLLRRLNDDVSHLTPNQIAALRKLYRLEDCRTIQELVEIGEVTA